MTPLAIDLYCGLGGWTEGLLAEGYRVVGFDLERHVYGEHRYPAQLVLQDVLTIHGRQFKHADLIVASPPCQAYSYMAMPWSRAKQMAREYEDGTRDVRQLTALFDACFRIQRAASEAAGRHIPLVVENVRGAQRWVGHSKWNFGSFHLWGDVPALMPFTMKRKNSGGSWFIDESSQVQRNDPRDAHLDRAIKVPTLRQCDCGHSEDEHGFNPDQPCNRCSCVNPVWLSSRRTAIGKGARFTSRDCGVEASGIKQGGDWFNDLEPSISRRTGSKSPARKAASALIAKIPLVLARHIARAWKPHDHESGVA